MDFDLLQNRPVCETRQCAEWLIDEWGHFDASISIADKISELSSTKESEELPLNFIAREEGKLLGIARILKTDLECMKELSPWLGDLYVEPLSRGHGVGTALVRRAEQFARDLGFPTLYLFVSNQQDFYFRWGWKLHSEVNEKGSLVKVLQKELSEPDSVEQAVPPKSDRASG